MELDDDGRHVHDGIEWHHGVPPEPENLLHVCSAFIYEFSLGTYDDPEAFFQWMNRHKKHWCL